MLEINQKENVLREVSREEVFTRRQITALSIFEQDHVEISFIDSSDNGDKPQTISITFEDYQKYLEHQICTLIDGANNDSV